MLTRSHTDVRPATAVQVLFVLFGITIAAFFPFLALFLDDRGLSPARIGIVIGAMAVGRIASGPVWGHLADTTIGRRSTLQIGALGSAVAALALFAAERTRRSWCSASCSRCSARRPGRTRTRSRSSTWATSG